MLYAEASANLLCSAMYLKVIAIGLPDGIFEYQISQRGHILDSLGMENFGIIYGRWEYFYSHLVYFVVI
jgi:hypothetical protein